MKLQIVKLFIIVSLLEYSFLLNAQQIDPALTAAVVVTGEAEKNALDKISSEQNKIAALQATINVNLSTIRSYEEKVYNYLHNVSGAIANAVEIKQALELTEEIVKACGSLQKAAAENPQGIVFVAIASKQVTKSTQDMIGVYSFLSSLVLSKETLLNANERNHITWTVLYKLRQIKADLYLLEYTLKNYTLADLPRVLFPESWYMYNDGKRIAQKIVNDFSKL
ncbi:hypothetical protein FACS189451_03960 [Bacteroidia bacterium]|nr:hypothetical protein FACS189446_1760 [Bacteroidia bacterium]GHT61593.1 hypothetical protein FACS189451_03960 [Bacteroidia bacterium]